MPEVPTNDFEALRTAASEGWIYDAGGLPPKDPSSWSSPPRGAGPVFDAQDIRDFLLGPKQPDEDRIVLLGLRGARIEGDLDLRELGGPDGQPLPPLILEYCRFTGEILLSHAHLQRLSLKGSRFSRLEATGCQIDGDVDLDDIASCEYGSDEDNPLIRKELFKSPPHSAAPEDAAAASDASPNLPPSPMGPTVNGLRLGLCSVNLSAARIDGTVSLCRAKLCGKESENRTYPSGKRPYALNFGAAQVEGNLSMQPGFVAIGGVMLADARIRGSVWLGGAKIRALASLPAIDAQSLHVGEAFQLRAVETGARERRIWEPFECLGEAKFLSAEIVSEFRISGGVFYPLPRTDGDQQPQGEALLALWMTSLGSVRLCSEGGLATIIHGSIALAHCDIKRSVVIEDTWLITNPLPREATATVFTVEKVACSRFAVLSLARTTIRGDLHIIGPSQAMVRSGWGTLCRIDHGMAANKLRVEGEAILMDIDVGTVAGLDDPASVPSATICDFSEAEIHNGFRVLSSWNSERTKIRDGLSLRGANIGGNVDLIDVRIERRRRRLTTTADQEPVWVPRLAFDATAVRVQGDMTLQCDFIGNVSLPRARIEGDLRLGRKLPPEESDGRTNGRQVLTLIDEGDRCAGAMKEHRQTVNLIEVEVRHSLEVAGIIVTTEEEEQARQRRSLYERAHKQALEESKKRRGSVSSVRYRRLPFYPGWLLAEAAVAMRGEERLGFAAFLVPEAMSEGQTVPDDLSDLVPLDGQSSRIHGFNGFASGRADGAELPEASPLHLDTSELATDYLKFFCDFVWGEEGGFRIVDSDDDLPEGAKMRLTGETVPSIELRPASARPDGKDFVVEETHVFYGGHLFKANFRLRPNGVPEMLDDSPLADLSDLPRDRYEPPLRFGVRSLLDTAAESSSTIFRLARKAWEEPASLLHRPPEPAQDKTKTRRSPVEIDLTGLSAGNLDDDDGIAWWDGKTSDLKLKEGFGWEPQRRWAQICKDRETADPLVRLTLAGFRYGRAEKRDPEIVLSQSADLLRTGESIVAKSFNEPKPERTLSAQVDAETRKTSDLIEARKRWLMLQYDSKVSSPSAVDGPKNTSCIDASTNYVTMGRELLNAIKYPLRILKNILPRRMTAHFCRPAGGLDVREFNPEAHEQLAKALASQGEFEAAREIIIDRSSMDHWKSFRVARDDAVPEYELVLAFGKTLIGRLHCDTCGYGLSTPKALKTFFACIIVGAFVTVYANHVAKALTVEMDVEATPIAFVEHGKEVIAIGSAIAPVREALAANGLDGISGGHPVIYTDEPLDCGHEINAPLYAIDVFIPLIDLHQESECRVKADRWGWEWAKAVYAMIGWIVTSLTILTVSGVAQRKIGG